MKRNIVLSLILALFIIPALAWAGPQVSSKSYPKNIKATSLEASGNIAGATYGSDGSITNAEFLYINSLSSNAQDQLDARCLESVFGTAIGTGLTLDGTTLKTQAALQSIAGLTETNGGLLYGTADNAYAWLAAGATTEILVGGGAGAPVWTTATGTGAPVRANNPVLIAPSLGDATATSITIDPSAIPAIELTDSNTTDKDPGVRFYGNATATGSGVEVYDWEIAAQGAATVGTMGDVISWVGATKILTLAGSMAVSTADVTCTDADDVCIYNTAKAQLWITAGTDATGDTMTVTAGSVAGETRTFTLVGGTDDVTIDVSTGTDSTLTGASEDSVTYRWDATTTTWRIIAGVGL